MEIERMQTVGIVVHDMEKGIEQFSRMFGVEFTPQVFPDDFDVEIVPTPYQDGITMGFDGYRLAIDDDGYFELLEFTSLNEGFRNIHLKVADMDVAKADAEASGLRLVLEYVVGTMREAVFDSGDTYGVRICLLEFPGNSLIRAMNEKRVRARTEGSMLAGLHAGEAE